MTEILMKWHPNSPQCAFQHYFYQEVGADRAPYYGVPDSEDPVKWEEALKSKPTDGSIPVLARGFGEIGIAGRIRLQDAAMKALYERVREIDASLGQRIEEHDLKFTVRTQEARRRHVALSRRCLALATKVQVLRNRGYALDAAEEELKAKLARLEKETFDPVVGGRQEELWARMTVVRERARMLKEETERLGKKAGEVEEASRIDEGTMGKIRQVSLAFLSFSLGNLKVGCG
jgi:nuclear pore complex protein Nup54